MRVNGLLLLPRGRIGQISERRLRLPLQILAIPDHSIPIIPINPRHIAVDQIPLFFFLVGMWRNVALRKKIN
jgi:hypothetical protein